MALSRVGVYGADRGGIVSFHSVLFCVGMGSREERKKSRGGGSGGDGVGRRCVGVKQDGKVGRCFARNRCGCESCSSVNKR